MISLIRNFPRLWNQFWFESNEALQFDLFRRLIGLVLFFCYLVRTFDLSFFYFDSGFLPVNKVSESILMTWRYSLLLWLSSDFWVWFFHVLFLVSLLGMVFKILPRWSTLLAFVLHVSFLHRTLMIAYGVDLISAFFLFYLCFADVRPAALQGDPDLRAGKDWRASLSSAAFRMAQIQLCIIYAYGGLQKLKGTHWWRGEAVWDMMANIQIARFDATWIAHFPSLIVVLTYATLAWEIYFPAFVWNKTLRPYVLAIGVIMHLMIMITVDIPYFSLLMISTYVLFLGRDQLKNSSLLSFFYK